MQRLMQLRAAVAFQAAQDIACQALAMQTNNGRGSVAFADNQRDVIGRIGIGPECHYFRISICSNGQPRARRYLERGAVSESRDITGRYAVHIAPRRFHR